jgi:tRNA pseudouridine38-40 synthase
MRIALGIAYDGAPFAGWQSQPAGNTVQDRLEAALAGIAGGPVRLTAAGRTDAGVHATAQVAHFDVDVARPESAWVRGTNAGLPPAIAVQWSAEVGGEFHARYSASGRTYRYVLYNHPVRPSVLAGKVGWFHLPLDADRMRIAAQALLGEHDFSAFRSAECQARTPVRQLSRATVERRGDYVLVELSANAFLHHMVRNVVGCLVHVGKGAAPPGWVAEVLAGGDRSRAAATFGPEGLYLAGVTYPERWKLPAFPPMLPLGGGMP